MDVPHSAFEVLDAFYKPLTALGSVPRRMARWLGDAEIGERSTVLDLGCGKGAVSVAAAASLGCSVVGIDAYPAFVNSCKQLARRRGVAELCEFRVGAIEARAVRKFDGVVLLNVLPFEEGAALARRWTKKGGIYIIDDAVRVRDDEAFEAFPRSTEVVEWIESLGDRVERSQVWAAAEVRKRDETNYKLLAQNAKSVMREYPEHAATIRECLWRQREAMKDLAGPIRPACWLVRRGR